jgi:hypothetical protein
MSLGEQHRLHLELALASRPSSTVTTQSISSLKRHRRTPQSRLTGSRSSAAENLTLLLDSGRKASLSTRTKTCETSTRTSDRRIARGGAVDNTLSNAVMGAIAFAAIEALTKRLLSVTNVKFPSSLGACLCLFFFLLVAESMNADFANAIFAGLTPGAGLLAKWLPVFFVPGLVLLPISPSVPSSFEVRRRPVPVSVF